MSRSAAGVSRETPPAESGSGEVGSRASRRPLTALALVPIRLYRRFVSPLLGPRCRYYPTCSAYAEQAVRELGPIRGAIVAAWRVLRCNPLSAGGIDPLEERTLFRARSHPDTHVERDLAA